MGDAPTRVGAASPASAALDRVFDTFYRQRPVSATFTGLHAHDGRLPDWSPQGLARANDEMRGLRRDLDAAGRVPDEHVTAFPAEVDLALADGALEIALAEHESEHFVHANPSLWTGEAIFGVLSLVTREFAPLGERLDHARQRLDAIPVFLASLPDVLVAAPRAWIGRAKRECQAAVPLFAQTLPAWVAAQAAHDPVALAGVDVAQWVAASTRAANAFQGLESWLEVPAPLGDGPAIRAMYAHECAGADLLGLLLRRGHFVTRRSQSCWPTPPTPWPRPRLNST